MNATCEQTTPLMQATFALHAGSLGLLALQPGLWPWGLGTLAAITGQQPCFFRPTAGLRNSFLEPILARHGLHLASWTRRGFDTRNRDADDVTRRLTRNLAAGDIPLLHDGHAARTNAGQSVILAVLPRVLEAAAAAAKTCENAGRGREP